jgi:hypothetical protein
VNRYAVKQSRGLDGPFIFTSASCAIHARIQAAGNTRRALRLQRLKVSDREGAFAAIIRCTADPAKADKRTRSKWSRLIEYAAGGLDCGARPQASGVRKPTRL